MPLMKMFKIRQMGLKSPCPSKRQTIQNTKSRNKFCPSAVLPLVVAFIFVFTVAQLIVIHRTIVSYKTRHQAFVDCYGSNSNANDSKVLVDLAFSRKFNPSFLNRSLEWSSPQKYPYRLPGPRHPPINHIWNPICPETPHTLKGNLSIDLNRQIFLDDLTKENPQVESGGKWTPHECRTRYSVALIIPYRYRWDHLKSLLGILHPMMQRQMLKYQIFVAEQYGNYTFNKGVLMNAAFLLAMNSSGNAFDCVIFHDVDLLPENDKNIYGCLQSPTHLSVAVDTYGYRLPYTSLVGGVFAISVDQFINVNGYSNLYWGWGAEDDDMYHRLMANHLRINRPMPTTARYKMLQHGHRLPNQFINPLIRTARIRFQSDGLTNCGFRLVTGSTQPLYTHFLVDIGKPSYFIQNKLNALSQQFQLKEDFRETHFQGSPNNAPKVANSPKIRDSPNLHSKNIFQFPKLPDLPKVPKKDSQVSKSFKTSPQKSTKSAQDISRNHKNNKNTKKLPQKSISVPELVDLPRDGDFGRKKPHQSKPESPLDPDIPIRDIMDDDEDLY